MYGKKKPTDAHSILQSQRAYESACLQKHEYDILPLHTLPEV